jgi:AcrR family transcriptional regulator
MLKTASARFAAKGYSAVSMRDLASAVGVMGAKLYHHLSDKEELTRASLSPVFSERVSTIEGLLEQHTSLDDRMEAFVSRFVKMIMGEELLMRLVLRELLDGTGERLEYLAKTVFKEPFSCLPV